MEYHGTTKAKNLAVSTGTQFRTGKAPLISHFSGDTSGKASPFGIAF